MFVIPRSGKRTVLYGLPKNVKICTVEFVGNFRYILIKIRHPPLNLNIPHEVAVAMKEEVNRYVLQLFSYDYFCIATVSKKSDREWQKNHSNLRNCGCRSPRLRHSAVSVWPERPAE